jgi:hypothetical protein
MLESAIRSPGGYGHVPTASSEIQTRAAGAGALRGQPFAGSGQAIRECPAEVVACATVFGAGRN